MLRILKISFGQKNPVAGWVAALHQNALCTRLAVVSFRSLKLFAGYDIMKYRRMQVLGVLTTVLFTASAAWGVSCATQSQMTAAQRTAFEQAARDIALHVQSGNVQAVQAETIASVAAHFGGIQSTIERIAPEIKGAAITVDDLYALDASDLKTAGEAQFFCGAAASTQLVTITIPQLPPGSYALAIVHATGVEKPEQMAIILENDPAGSAQWKLAGFIVRPLSVAGHDGLWYWKQARIYAAKKQDWAAYFYYQMAAYLVTPVDFLTSPNLQKLLKEENAARPAELPSGAAPLTVSANGQTFSVTGLRTDSSLGGLDLAVTYTTASVSDPVATRSQILALMKALLQQHPGLREAFHGLWVYAEAAGQRPFAIELPMNKIQ